MGNKQEKKSSTELTDKHIALLRTNTQYSEKEIRERHKAFIDKYPSGLLDKKTFAETYKKFYPDGKVDNYCKYAFATFDKDNSGTIDFQEFLLSVAARSQKGLDGRLTVAFDKYDISKDGLIDQKELTNVITAMYDLEGVTDRDGDANPKNVAADIITKLDIDGDRKLSEAEFIFGLKSHPVFHRLLSAEIAL